VAACICGQTTIFGPDVMQRVHRVPSDTLIYDLRFRLRCRRCKSEPVRMMLVDKREWQKPAELRKPGGLIYGE
jgi:hypothetical protein